MAFHVVHVLTNGSRLHVDRGLLVCKNAEGERKLPLEDIMAVIVAARGVSFSEGCLIALLERKAIVLHCDEKFRPIGLTAPLFQVVHNEVFSAQISQATALNERIWEKLIEAKTRNQAALLDAFDIPHDLLKIIGSGHINEGYAAKRYWDVYFSRFYVDAPGTREHRGATDKVNACLNYGYAVLKSLVHRSAIVHGLNPSLGVHHKHRFKTDPLIYDLIEPLRSVCDYALLAFYRRRDNFEFEEWARFFAGQLVSLKIQLPEGKCFKLLNTIDRYCASVASCFSDGDVECLFVPLISHVVTGDDGRQ